MIRGRKGFCLFPGYNWCGPKCSGPGAPINDVDAACRAHDICYATGRNRCECDREFLRALHSKIDPFTEKGRNARLMYRYMKMQSFFRCKF
ncbi:MULTISPECIES: phospholipase [Sporosarcina]|uniref:Phospholipase n=1 Tax=Sporosarcina contaminans TaxID=633403 RepID=A0ABW3U043_9BACL